MNTIKIYNFELNYEKTHYILHELANLQEKFLDLQVIIDNLKIYSNKADETIELLSRYKTTQKDKLKFRFIILDCEKCFKYYVLKKLL